MTNYHILNFDKDMVIAESTCRTESELLANIQKALDERFGKNVDTINLLAVMQLREGDCLEHGFRIISGPQRAVHVGPVEEWHATTRWHVEDVVGAASEQGVDLTEEEANAWFGQNERSFRELLVGAGNDILAEMDFGAFKAAIDVRDLLANHKNAFFPDVVETLKSTLPLAKERLTANEYSGAECLLAKMEEVVNAWEDFGDVPMDPETECIDVAWNQFQAGTHRETIWHWFEDYHDISVAKNLMGQ